MNVVRLTTVALRNGNFPRCLSVLLALVSDFTKSPSGARSLLAPSHISSFLLVVVEVVEGTNGKRSRVKVVRKTYMEEARAR